MSLLRDTDMFEPGPLAIVFMRYLVFWVGEDRQIVDEWLDFVGWI